MRIGVWMLWGLKMGLVMQRLCGWRGRARKGGREGWEGGLAWWRWVLGLMEEKGLLFP